MGEAEEHREGLALQVVVRERLALVAVSLNGPPIGTRRRSAAAAAGTAEIIVTISTERPREKTPQAGE